MDDAEQAYQARCRRDFARVRAILDGDDLRWNDLLEELEQPIGTVAKRWCHLRFPHSVCKRCRPGAVDDCDEWHSAYAFIIGILRRKVLRSYKGLCPLEGFLHPLFSRLPSRRGRFGNTQMLAEYLRQPGREDRPPEALGRLSQIEKKAFVLMHRRRDDASIAQALGLDVGSVSAMRSRFDALLRAEGPEKWWYWLGYLTVEEVPPVIGFEDDSGDEPEEAEAADMAQDPERDALAAEILGSVSPQERVILRLLYYEDWTVAAVARALNIQTAAIRATLDRIRARFTGRAGVRGRGEQNAAK